MLPVVLYCLIEFDQLKNNNNIIHNTYINSFYKLIFH